jgi:hypothetical protein
VSLSALELIIPGADISFAFQKSIQEQIMFQLHPSFELSVGEIAKSLDSSAPFLPELKAARLDLAVLRSAPQTQKTLAWTDAHMARLAEIPQTKYSAYRLFIGSGDRREYETPYFAKRTMLAGAALRLFLGQDEMKDPLQDLIWDICEETNWVLPAHERGAIDLFSAETAFMLGETLALLDDLLDAEVRSRVRFEVERRVFQPYLTTYDSFSWYQAPHNWNGVCNSAVAAAFLLLEPEQGRVAQALAIAFKGLRTFLNTAFESDGSSTEGVSYWHYGLINFVALAEMLRARSHGAIDLLDCEHIRQVAAYPARMLLSPARFATFSDCDELLNFNPGIISRLMDRTGERTLQSLLSEPVPSERQWRLTMMLRDMLWWDGAYHQQMPEADAYLPVGGVARFVARTPKGTPVALAVKSGHNAENHNQNDVGSFILHIGEESFLVDPGRGLYSRQYFGPQRYQSIFANSYGHSVPVIDGQLQKNGRQYYGEMTAVETGASQKCAEVEMANAYPVQGLSSLRRRITLSEQGEFLLQDTFRFAETPLEVEEALITWLEVDASTNTAMLHGDRCDLKLTILAPANSCFQIERLEQVSRENQKPGVLKRLIIQLPPGLETKVSLQAEIIEKSA